MWRPFRDSVSILTAADAHAPLPIEPSGRPLASPYSVGLSPIVLTDVYGPGTAVPVDRSTALSVPALGRAVTLVKSSVARLPLRTYRGDVEIPSEPWTYTTAGQLHPAQRLAQTVEDLILCGWSLWARANGTRGQLVDAAWVPPDAWMFDGDGTVCDANGAPLDASEVILFRGPQDGILITGARTIRGAIALERAWVKAAATPIPAVVLQNTTDDQLTDTEIVGLLDAWRLARRDPEGAVAYLPAGLELQTPGAQVSADILEGARNAAAVDIARLVGVPAVAIDAGPTAQGLDYRNVNQATGLQLPLYGLQPYTDVVDWRLSMDDVTPRGTRIALDTTSMLAVPAEPAAPESRD